MFRDTGDPQETNLEWHHQNCHFLGRSHRSILYNKVTRTKTESTQTGHLASSNLKALINTALSVETQLPLTVSKGSLHYKERYEMRQAASPWRNPMI